MRIGKLIAFGIAVLILTSVLRCSVWAATELSKEKIIEIAKTKALERGVNLDAAKVIYDEGNKMFTRPIYPEQLPGYAGKESIKGAGSERNPTNFEGKNFQAVYFVSQQAMGKNLWVLIDRGTGEVIDAVGDY